MLREKKNIWTALGIAAGLILSWLLTIRLSSYQPSNVFLAAYENGYLYGAEMETDCYRIFRVDTETGTSRSIRVLKNRDGKAEALDNMVAAADGNLYLVRSITQGTETQSQIVVCDFDRRRLVPAWNLADIGEGSFRGMERYRDSLQLLFSNNGQHERYIHSNGEWVLLDRISFPEDIQVYMVSITEDGGYYIFETYGDIYRLNEDGSFSCIYKADGLACNFQFYKNACYFEDVDSGQTYRIGTEAAPYTPVPCARTYPAPASFDERDMTLSMYYHGTVKAGVLSLEDGRKTAAVCGEREYVAETLHWGSLEVFVVWAAVCGLLGLGVSAVRSFWRFLKRREILFPLAAKAALLSLALMASGFWIIRLQINRAIRASSTETNIAACLRLGYERMGLYDWANIQAMCGFDRITAENVLPEERDAGLYQALEDGNETGTSRNVEYHLYFEKEGELYPIGMEKSYHILNTPLRYNIVGVDTLALRAMEKALTEGVAVSVEYAGLEGQQYAVMLPFETEEGEYPVVLEVSMTMASADQTFAVWAAQLERLTLWMAAALLTVILLMLWQGMRPLGILKQAVQQVERGRLGTVAKIRGRSEAAATAVEFNHMSEQIAKQVEGSGSYQKKYAAFVPLEFLEEAGGGPLAEAGDVRQRGRILLSVDFAADGHLPEQIRRVHEKQGEVLSFGDDGLQCLFLGEEAHALEAAIHMLQDANRRKKERPAAAVSYEQLRLGVAGDSLRRTITAFPVGGDTNGLLRQWARKYRASLLVTGTAADRISGFFQRYHVRRLGECLLEGGHRTERIYEVLDGEPEAEKRKKLLTLDVFEEGLAAFERGDFLTARIAFVRVLAVHGGDGAAACYIRLCEHNLSAEPGGIRRYLETVT